MISGFKIVQVYKLSTTPPKKLDGENVPLAVQVHTGVHQYVTLLVPLVGQQLGDNKY